MKKKLSWKFTTFIPSHGSSPYLSIRESVYLLALHCPLSEVTLNIIRGYEVHIACGGLKENGSQREEYYWGVCLVGVGMVSLEVGCEGSHMLTDHFLL